ncbi:transmembrane emp24 domain-containing protein p24delta5-like isoform X4 [Rhodamnia argentea]|uniref:Transmembrane emp24 domain-containing protein p24delta5-like isoform X4 n=1 Tax=Rhodamnia argentea TaxID=178133 RepID=A0ABM3H004_9MYRT|nr:transmembrane emp24 domain-containing protein p24delta5-like isoform X4 [Rhodamnia argentea]
MAERRAEAILLVALLLLGCSGHLVPVTEAVWLTIPSSGTKCVSEEIQSNVVVLADYYIVDEEHAHLHTATISSRVTSPYGNNLHHNENVTHGQFAFTTSEAGNYLACFWIGGKHQEAAGLTIGLDWKIGIAAKDWESVAKREKIQGMELELLKLEGAVQAIHDNLIYLKNRLSLSNMLNEHFH